MVYKVLGAINIGYSIIPQLRSPCNQKYVGQKVVQCNPTVARFNIETGLLPAGRGVNTLTATEGKP